jgi:hypothetical protein
MDNGSRRLTYGFFQALLDNLIAARAIVWQPAGGQCVLAGGDKLASLLGASEGDDSNGIR